MIEHLLAIGCALGKDGHPRAFRDVFEIMWRWYFLDRYTADVASDIQRKRARDLAWTRCFRTFRGTDGQTPGVCFTKDILYAQGNEQLWRIAAHDPDLPPRLTSGKYHPMDPWHVHVAHVAGALDEDDALRLIDIVTSSDGGLDHWAYNNLV